MSEQTETLSQEAVAYKATTEDFKHAVLIVSVLINLTLFISWILTQVV